MTPPVGVLALQGAFASHVRALRALGAAAVEVRRPEELEDLAGIVVPGGESTTMALLLRSAGMDGVLRRRLAAGMPALGTCAGMILMSEKVLDGRADQLSLGAIDIDVRRNAFGRQVASFEGRVDLVDDPARPMHATFIRAPAVERCGPDVEVLGTLEGQPVLCRQGAVLVSSFHPELGDDLRIHESFLQTLEVRR